MDRADRTGADRRRPRPDEVRPPAARRAFAAGINRFTGLPMVGYGNRFVSARKKLCAAALDAARWQMQPLVDSDRFDQAEAEAKGIANEWRDEAKAIGLTEEFTAFAEGFAYLADLARAAGRKR